MWRKQTAGFEYFIFGGGSNIGQVDPDRGWGGGSGGGLCVPDVFFLHPHAAAGFHTSGRLKLTVLSEERLQIKWKEADGPVQGYKVRVRPISGETAGPDLAGSQSFTKNTTCLRLCSWSD